MTTNLTTKIDTYPVRKFGGWSIVELSCIRVFGTDARRFLQSQTTNDVNIVAEGGGHSNCLIDRKSRPVGCFRMYLLDSEYAIICDTKQTEPILEHLDKFRFADRVDFEEWKDARFITIQGPRSRTLMGAIIDGDGTHQLSSVDAFSGDISGQSVKIFRLSLTGEDGYLIVSDQETFKVVLSKLEAEAGALNVVSLDQATLDACRIEAGLPKLGVDFDGDNLLAETTLDETSVSYTKGCFQGQEVLARVRSQGAPTRALVGLTLAPPPVSSLAVDTEIKLDNEVIGWIKSNLHSKVCNEYIAFAMVRRDYRTPGKEWQVSLDGQDYTAKVQLLPFYQAISPQQQARRTFEDALQEFAREDEKQAGYGSLSIELLRESLLLDPHFEDAYEALGVILNRRGQADEAIKLMQQLATLNPDSVMAHTNLSVFYMEKGLKEKAEEEKAISMSIEMRLALQQSKDEKKKEKERQVSQEETLERMGMFREVLDIDEDDQLANYGYGDCLVELGRFEEALLHLKRSIELKPTHTVAYLALGKAYEGLVNSKEARAAYESGIDVAAKRGDMEPLKKMQARLDKLV